jgi:glyoxylase-like metal-dependent hydrolase (beta-lactamase superfamily II)
VLNEEDSMTETLMSPRVHHMPLPTPFAVGTVNTYLIEDDPLTLVDSGPDSGTTLIALVEALAERGRRIEDLERIVLTHQHIDHIGLAGILAERSGAEVCALAALGPWLGDYTARMEAEDRFAERLMLRHGIPSEITLVLRAVTRQTRAYGNPVMVTHALRDGDALEFADRTWRVGHRPGHSPSDTTFHDEASGELLVGDHLIKHISSNAVLSLPLSGEPESRPHPLAVYRDSLRQTRETDAKVVRSGHGEQIEDHRAVIDKHLAGHERRAERIVAILREHGPLTAFEIAQRIWNTVAVTQAFLTFSEVYGHTDLLLARGDVEEHDDGEFVRYVVR